MTRYSPVYSPQLGRGGQKPVVNGRQTKGIMSNKSIGIEGAESAPQFQFVETGIYRKSTNDVYYERPKVNGKRTWRSLATSNLKHAREELHRRRAAIGTHNDPYAETEAVMVGEIISRYQKDGYLDKNLNGRAGGTLIEETRNCGTLLEFWKAIPVNAVTDAVCDRYRDWRIKRTKNGKGKRVIDRELNTLNNAFRYAKRRAIVRLNPVADRPRYQSSKEVRHCRDFMPGSADELHEFVAVLMKNPHSVVLGFQQLFEAMTGLRTSEILKLQTSAKPNEPGYVTPDGKSLRVWRCKGQHAVNPFVKVHAGLKGLIEAHKKWKEEFYPDSPWYFPSPRGVDGPLSGPPRLAVSVSDRMQHWSFWHSCGLLWRLIGHPRSIADDTVTLWDLCEASYAFTHYSWLKAAGQRRSALATLGVRWRGQRRHHRAPNPGGSNGAFHGVTTSHESIALDLSHGGGGKFGCIKGSKALTHER